MTPNDSWSDEEETSPQEPRPSTDAESVPPVTNVIEDEGEGDAWCEVSHHRKKKAGTKSGDSGTHMEAGKGAKGGTEGGKGGYGKDSPTKKGGKGQGKKASKEDKSSSKDEHKSPLKEASNTPSMSPQAKSEAKPLPPWRRQNPGSPSQFPMKDPTGEVQSPLKSGGYGPRTSPKSAAFTSPVSGAKADQEANELAHGPDLALPPIAVSFRPLHKDKDSSPTKEVYRPPKGDRGDDHASPEKTESPTKDHGEDKEDGKRRVRDDVHEEVNALLDGSDALLKSDFDGKARQFLHAIHNLAGRPGVHEALKMISLSTNKKSRDSVRNWNGYISTLLQKYFQEIGGGKKNSERREEKGEEKVEDKEQKDPPKTEGPPAALAGSLTAAPLVFGPPRARAKA
jgi:hypothetical protein